MMFLKKSKPKLFQFFLNLGVPCALLAVSFFVFSDPAHAGLREEVDKMKQVAQALQDVCAGATEATMVVLGIHYSGKFIKYALG